MIWIKFKKRSTLQQRDTLISFEVINFTGDFSTLSESPSRLSVEFSSDFSRLTESHDDSPNKVEISLKVNQTWTITKCQTNASL